MRVVGFDMDGTLYDEFEFIEQAYAAVAQVLAPVVLQDAARIHAELLHRWLEKGSAYPRMFIEVLERYDSPIGTRDDVVEECLRAFRIATPRLRLSPRIRTLLDGFATRYPLFLVTDGRSEVQRGKIRALGLDRWFSAENVVISGELDGGIRKPDAAMAGHAAAVRETGARGGEVVFFGDRDVDEAFARNCGFQFLRVHCMVPIAVDGADAGPRLLG